jgi:hypothetical protein
MVRYGKDKFKLIVNMKINEQGSKYIIYLKGFLASNKKRYLQSKKGLTVNLKHS